MGYPLHPLHQMKVLLVRGSLSVCSTVVLPIAQNITALWNVSGIVGKMGQVQQWEQAQEEDLGRRMKS